MTRAKIGGSLEDERAEGEVRYYDVNDRTGKATVGPGAGEKEVPLSYGVWRQETLDAHGGWIAMHPTWRGLRRRLTPMARRARVPS